MKDTGVLCLVVSAPLLSPQQAWPGVLKTMTASFLSKSDSSLKPKPLFTNFSLVSRLGLRPGEIIILFGITLDQYQN